MEIKSSTNLKTETPEEKHNGNVFSPVIFLITLIILVGCFFYIQANRSYIDGNVFNIGYINIETKKLASPWKNHPIYSELMFRSLFSTDATFTDIEMDLARSYEIIENGKIYKIKFRDKSFWSDGEPITIDDVIFSLETILVSDNVNGIYVSALKNIIGAEKLILNPENGLDGLEVIDDTTLIINLEKPSTTFLKILAQIVILPKHAFSKEDLETDISTCDYWTNPIVSGMYKTDGIVDNAYFKLIHNDLYTGGNFSDIEEIRLHSFESNAPIDYFITNNITEMINYSSSREYEKFDVDMLFYRYFVFNIKGDDGHINEAMNDVRVREAISYAIDRESAFYDIYFNTGSIINSGVTNSHEACNDFSYTYDPLKAIALLKEANYDFSRPIKIAYYYSDETSKVFINKIAGDLKTIGLNVELIKSENATIDLYETRAYDFALKGLAAFDINEWYIEYQKDHPFFSKTYSSDGEFDELINALEFELDNDSYLETLKKLQSLEQEKIYKLPLFTLNQAVYVNKDRIETPDGIVFGNTWYRYDLQFDKWNVKKI